MEVERPVESASERLRRDQELEGLRLQVNRLSADLNRVQATVSNVTGVPANIDPPPILSREEDEQRWLDHVQTIDRGFRDEPLSADWAREMSQKILTEVSSDPHTAGLVVDVHCRSRTCKLELANTDSRRTERGVRLMIEKFSMDLQTAVIGHDGDLAAPKASTLYLSKARPEDSVPLMERR